MSNTLDLGELNLLASDSVQGNDVKLDYLKGGADGADVTKMIAQLKIKLNVDDKQPDNKELLKLMEEVQTTLDNTMALNIDGSNVKAKIDQTINIPLYVKN